MTFLFFVQYRLSIACEISGYIIIEMCHEVGGLVVNTSDSGSRGRGFETNSGRRVVSLSKTYLPPKKYW